MVQWSMLMAFLINGFDMMNLQGDRYLCVVYPFSNSIKADWFMLLQWRHNGCDGVSNHQPHHCLLNHLFRRRSKKTSKLRFTGLCAGNSPMSGEFPAQIASNAKNVSIWWRHHIFTNSIGRQSYQGPFLLPYLKCIWDYGINMCLHA